MSLTVLSTLATVVHVITCLLLVLVVLLQSGKGAEISASFAGSSQTVFGSSGGANFFTKFTYGAAGVFMITSLFLTWSGNAGRGGVFKNYKAAAPVTAPANPAAPAAGAPAQNAAPAAPAAGAPAQNAAPSAPAAGAPAQKPAAPQSH